MKVAIFTQAMVRAQVALGWGQMTIHAMTEGLRAMKEYEGQEESIAQMEALLPEFQSEVDALQRLASQQAQVFVSHEMVVSAAVQQKIASPYLAMVEALEASGAKKVAV